MAEGWPDLGTDPERQVTEIIALTTAVKAVLSDWRSTINATGSTTGMEAAEKYQQLAAYRNYMIAAVGANAADISAAYLRRRPAIGTFDAAASWAKAQVGVDAFLDWFQTGWPRKDATTNAPAFQGYNANKELGNLAINFGATAKTQILARLDAVIAALPSA